jgi:hypothetical protein
MLASEADLTCRGRGVQLKCRSSGLCLQLLCARTPRNVHAMLCFQCECACAFLTSSGRQDNPDVAPQMVAAVRVELRRPQGDFASQQRKLLQNVSNGVEGATCAITPRSAAYDALRQRRPPGFIPLRKPADDYGSAVAGCSDHRPMACRPDDGITQRAAVRCRFVRQGRRQSSRVSSSEDSASEVTPSRAASSQLAHARLAHARLARSGIASSQVAFSCMASSGVASSCMATSSVAPSCVATPASSCSAAPGAAPEPMERSRTTDLTGARTRAAVASGR